MALHALRYLNRQNALTIRFGPVLCQRVNHQNGFSVARAQSKWKEWQSMMSRHAHWCPLHWKQTHWERSAHFAFEMKCASLGLAEGRKRSLPTLLREKTTSSVFVSTCSNPVHLPSFIDLHTHATAGHVTSFACTKLHSTCSPNTSGRSLAWSHHTITKIYAIRRDRPETWNTSGKPLARLLDQTGAKQWPLFSRSRQSLSGHDRSNARRPRTGRGRGPWWRRGGVVSLDGRCSAQAEQRKKPVAVGPLPGAYLSTETNLVPIRGVMRKEFDTGQTRTHTELKRCGPPGPRRFAHVTLGKNEIFPP